MYLNNIKIIDKKAELQMAIFRILIDLYIEEFHAGEMKYISISKIDSLLKSMGFDLDDPETQIGISIYRIRTSIKSAFKDLQIHSIIETKKWKGYRLSDQVILKKSGMM